MRSSIRPIATIGLVIGLVAACSDAAQPVAPIAGDASPGPSYGKNPGAGPGVHSNLPPTLNLPGGAHFALFCTTTGLSTCIYMPVNDAARAIAPHGLTLQGVPIPS